MSPRVENGNPPQALDDTYRSNIGLDRQKREVHGEHGGRKEKLRCKEVGCKRFQGKPFARKGNLDRHRLRLHGTTTTSDGPRLEKIASAASDLVGAPLSHLPDMGTAATELQQLKATGLKQDERIRILEKRDVQSEARLKSIEHTFAQLT